MSDRPATPPGPKPDWSASQKEASLIAYGAWLNDLARASFLDEQRHPEMFFLVTRSGELLGMQFRAGLDQGRKNALVQAEAARVRPCGSIHIRIATAVALPGLRFPFEGAGEPATQCLLVHLESEEGPSRSWASAIIEGESGLGLGPAAVVQEVVWQEGPNRVA